MIGTGERTMRALAVGLLGAALAAGCGGESEMTTQATGVTSEPFGTVDGDTVMLYTVRNASGIEMRVMTYGGIIQALEVPDREGRMADVVLGFDSLSGYLSGHPYFGAIIGRYGNRIAGGQFTLDGETYQLATNDGSNHLHGGDRGFDKVIWDAEPFEGEGERGVVFRYTSPDGEEGYPGRLETTVTYTLNDDDELIFDYHAVTDEATPVNLTQHSYFNLQGHGAGPILDHVVTIDAEYFTPVDSTLIPTGELRPVEGTPFDFTEPTAIGARIDAENQQLAYGPGYDHNFVLRRGGPAEEPQLAARVREPDSGRVMEIYTTEPGLQFYSGNFLDGTLTGKDGVVYEHRTGFAMETQHFPDSPNQPEFPSTILRPGEEYETRTIYRFTTTDDG